MIAPRIVLESDSQVPSEFLSLIKDAEDNSPQEQSSSTGEALDSKDLGMFSPTNKKDNVSAIGWQSWVLKVC